MGSRILDFPVIPALNCGLTRPAGPNLVQESEPIQKKETHQGISEPSPHCFRPSGQDPLFWLTLEPFPLIREYPRAYLPPSELIPLPSEIADVKTV